MNLFTRRSHQKNLPLPAKLYGSLQSLAKKEGISPGELIARWAAEMEMQHRTSESLAGRWKRLTPREQQIVALVCTRMTVGEIALRLGISPNTVRTHLRKAMVRLDLHSKYTLLQVMAGFDFGPWVE